MRTRQGEVGKDLAKKGTLKGLLARNGLFGACRKSLLILQLRRYIYYLRYVLWHFQCRAFGRSATSPKILSS
jgi:hypothetical protein